MRDDVGDGHDDITVLQRLPNGHTRVKKLCMNTKLYAFLWPERSVAVDVPARLETLAPVTMLRVYCTCPGVSAMMNFRFGVAK